MSRAYAGGEEPALERLLAAARRRFAQDGYAATSLEAVAADAGLAPGAVDRLFQSKAELFADVLHHEHVRVARRVADASAAYTDPWEAAHAGLRAFLDATADPGVQRITLVDAPNALGASGMREVGSPYGLALVRHGLARLRRDGELAEHDSESLAHLLFGATHEAAMYIAHATDQQSARDKMERELSGLVETLRG